MAHHPVQFYLTLEDQLGVEHEFEARCTVAPGSPGKTYGPPEDCYPPEPPEVDDMHLFQLAGTLRDGKECYAEIPEKAWSQFGISYETLADLAVDKANQDAEDASMDYCEDDDDRRSSCFTGEDD